MYRKQMMLQRILCIVIIVASAIVFVYALGFMTDANDMIRDAALGYTPASNESEAVKAEFEAKKAPMRRYLEDMNAFDSDFIRVGIGLILVSLTLIITNTQSRRKYYISNYASSVITSASICAAAAWAHNGIVPLKNQYYSGAIDFEFVKAATADNAREGAVNVYTESAFWFDFHYYIFGILLLMAALLILNTIWKIILMKHEKNALATGRTEV